MFYFLGIKYLFKLIHILHFSVLSASLYFVVTRSTRLLVRDWGLIFDKHLLFNRIRFFIPTDKTTTYQFMFQSKSVFLTPKN